MNENAEAGPSNDPHRMRISSGGNIQKYVKFALTHLNDRPDKPLVIHSIPPSLDSSSKIILPASTTTLHPATLTIPKLISVVEIIKREYISSLISTGRGSAQHRSKGLWQYNEVGNLPTGVQGVGEVNSLENVLNGKTRPKMIHRPYMQVTLSTRPLGLKRENGTTCQYVLGKRRRKGNSNDEANQEVQEGGPAVVNQGETEDMLVSGKTVSAETVPDVQQPASRGPNLASDIGGTEKKRKSLSSQEGRPVKRKKGTSGK